MVNPLSTLLPPAPSYPPAWAGKPEWRLWGGVGVIAALQYDDTPVGPYNELLYIVGPYKSDCKAWAFSSILRIWVDLPATRHAGRSIWGIPKEMASFQWRDTNTTLGVTVTDPATGELLFDATTKDTFVAVDWFRALLPTSLQTVQWPIAATGAVGTVPAYRVSEDALAAGKAITTAMQIDYTGALLNTVSSVAINQAAFTGRHKQRYPLQVLGVGVSVKSGRAKPVFSIHEPSMC